LELAATYLIGGIYLGRLRNLSNGKVTFSLRIKLLYSITLLTYKLPLQFISNNMERG
jgi:hypothetical protein